MRIGTSIQRRLARAIASCAARILPPVEQDWSDAIRYEAEFIESDGQALQWSIGCLRMSCQQRLASIVLGPSPWIIRALAVFLLLHAMSMFFAPAMIASYRLHAFDIAQMLGSRTPGDDFRRLVPLMDATPGFIIALWIGSGCLSLAAGWRASRRLSGAFELFVAALALQIFSLALEQLMPGYAQLDRDTFTFAEPNIRRDIMLPAARVLLTIGGAALLWARSVSSHAPEGA